MRLYGRMAKDKTLETDAAEIRIRAERRLGQMIASQKETVGLNKGNNFAAVLDDDRRIPTLSDVGVSKNLSSRAQKLAGDHHEIAHKSPATRYSQAETSREK